MPTIKIADREIECELNQNLRRVLMRSGAHLYNGIAGTIHCRGLGTCGTCAIKVEGPVTEMTSIEKLRLSMPPHSRQSGLRLACQCRVLGDLECTKLAGLWGNRAEDEEK